MFEKYLSSFVLGAWAAGLRLFITGLASVAAGSLVQSAFACASGLPRAVLILSSHVLAGWLGWLAYPVLVSSARSGNGCSFITSSLPLFVPSLAYRLLLL